ncbi:MAG: potassium channel protein [Polyangiales bacterium]
MGGHLLALEEPSFRWPVLAHHEVRSRLEMLWSRAFRRLPISFGVLLTTWVVGALGYFFLGHGLWTLGESAYQTVITIFSVGFSELPHAARVRGARTFTAIIIGVGVGAVAFVQASVTALLVEGALGEAYRRSRMQRSIDALDGHIVVAGIGSTGRYVIEELQAIKRRFVAIDRSETRLREIADEVCSGEMLYVVGDATQDHSLLAAGVARAEGVVAALTDDADNLYVTLSARALNAKARIVTKAVNQEADPKMRRAGASAVVSPNTIGGRRMASELVRPEVVEFLDQMHRTDHSLRMEEVIILATSPLVGKMLREAPIRPRTKALVIAKRSADGSFLYNPGPESRIEAGMTLIVLGDQHDIATLRKLVTTG